MAPRSTRGGWALGEHAQLLPSGRGDREPHPSGAEGESFPSPFKNVIVPYSDEKALSYQTKHAFTTQPAVMLLGLYLKGVDTRAQSTWLHPVPDRPARAGQGAPQSAVPEPLRPVGDILQHRQE